MWNSETLNGGHASRSEAPSFFIQLHATTLNNVVLLFPSGKSGLPIPKQEPFDAHGLQWLWGCQSQLSKCKQGETHPSHHSAPSADIALKDTFLGFALPLVTQPGREAELLTEGLGSRGRHHLPPLRQPYVNPAIIKWGSCWDKD